MLVRLGGLTLYDGGGQHQALTDLGAQARFTRHHRPQTNGKAERFNRTMADEVSAFHREASS
jgi:transposase InsO family protein